MSSARPRQDLRGVIRPTLRGWARRHRRMGIGGSALTGHGAAGARDGASVVRRADERVMVP